MNLLRVLLLLLPGVLAYREASVWNYPYRRSPLQGETSYIRNGEYTFVYDTGNGQHQSFRRESRDGIGRVSGYYGYVDPDGVLRVTEYFADEFGYRARTTLRYLVLTTV